MYDAATRRVAAPTLNPDSAATNDVMRSSAAAPLVILPDGNWSVGSTSGLVRGSSTPPTGERGRPHRGSQPWTTNTLLELPRHATRPVARTIGVGSGYRDPRYDVRSRGRRRVGPNRPDAHQRATSPPYAEQIGATRAAPRGVSGRILALDLDHRSRDRPSARPAAGRRYAASR